MISNEAVEQVCSEVGEYSDDQMASEFERFFGRQPELCDFIVELTGESGTKIQELSLFLSYMIFKAVESSGPEALNEITHEAIESAMRESESWIEKINQIETGEIESAILSN